MLALELVGGTWRIDGCGRRSRPRRKPRLLSVSGRTAAIRRKGNPRRLRGRMDHGDAMTDVPPKTRRMPPPENAVQWGILVFWAVVIVIWTWYLSLFAAWATQEGSLDAITLWLLALTSRGCLALSHGPDLSERVCCGGSGDPRRLCHSDRDRMAERIGLLSADIGGRGEGGAHMGTALVPYARLSGRLLERGDRCPERAFV